MKLHPRNNTPMARQRMSAKDHATIRLAEPAEYTAEFGYSNGWTCRLRNGNAVVGEAYHMATIGGALASALKDMREKVPA